MVTSSLSELSDLTPCDRLELARHCHVKDAPWFWGIKVISDSVNVIVGQHDLIFRTVEELSQCEPEVSIRRL